MTANPKATATAALLFSLPSFGNILAKTYAYGCGEFPTIFPVRCDWHTAGGRVGNVISDRKLFPLWRLLSHQFNFEYPTNSGAYLVQWVACVVAIDHRDRNTALQFSRLLDWDNHLRLRPHVGRCHHCRRAAVGRSSDAAQTSPVDHCHPARVVNTSVLVMNAIPIACSDSYPGKPWIRPTIVFAVMGMEILWGLFLCLLDPQHCSRNAGPEALGVRMEITPYDHSELTWTGVYFQVRSHYQVIVRAGSLTEAVTGR